MDTAWDVWVTTGMYLLFLLKVTILRTWPYLENIWKETRICLRMTPFTQITRGKIFIFFVGVKIMKGKPRLKIPRWKFNILSRQFFLFFALAPNILSRVKERQHCICSQNYRPLSPIRCSIFLIPPSHSASRSSAARKQRRVSARTCFKTSMVTG